PMVQLTMGADREFRLLYAPLQGGRAKELLAPHGIDPSALDTVVVLKDFGLESERAFTRSAAAFELAAVLGGWYRPLSWLRVLPRFLTDGAYRVLARYRYRVFGRYDQCTIPTPESRKRFIDTP
ncbi:MAG: DCC1-like thiol-disulfide oxidoreductase family protein, partial [Myxococcota bacterium]